MSDKAFFLLFVDQPAHRCIIYAAPVLFTAISFKILASLCSLAGWFELYMVPNPKTSFLETWYQSHL